MLYRAEPKVHQGSAFAVARFLNNPALPFGENSGSLGLSLLLEGLESLLGTLAEARLIALGSGRARDVGGAEPAGPAGLSIPQSPGLGPS